MLDGLIITCMPTERFARRLSPGRRGVRLGRGSGSGPRPRPPAPVLMRGRPIPNRGGCPMSARARLTALPSAMALALLIAAPAARPADVASFDELLRLVRADPDPASVLEKCGANVFTLSRAQRVQLVKAGATAALVDAVQKPRMALEDV